MGLVGASGEDENEADTEDQRLSSTVKYTDPTMFNRRLTSIAFALRICDSSQSFPSCFRVCHEFVLGPSRGTSEQTAISLFETCLPGVLVVLWQTNSSIAGYMEYIGTNCEHQNCLRPRQKALPDGAWSVHFHYFSRAAHSDQSSLAYLHHFQATPGSETVGEIPSGFSSTRCVAGCNCANKAYTVPDIDRAT